MQDAFTPEATVKKIKVNWANECVTGAFLSAAFTVMASHAGTGGAAAGSLAARLHEFIVMGGISMSVVCGFSGLAIVLFQLLENVMRQLSAAAEGGWIKNLSLRNLQTAKFIKIFLP